MPAPATSARDAFPGLLQGLMRRLEALEVWIRATGVPGEWIPLALSAALEENTSAYVPAARVGGGATNLRGLLKVKAGKELVAGGLIATLPVAQRPTKTVGMVATSVAGAIHYVTVQINGEILLGLAPNLKAEEQLWLDGLTFSIT